MFWITIDMVYHDQLIWAQLVPTPHSQWEALVWISDESNRRRDFQCNLWCLQRLKLFGTLWRFHRTLMPAHYATTNVHDVRRCLVARGSSVAHNVARSSWNNWCSFVAFGDSWRLNYDLHMQMQWLVFATNGGVWWLVNAQLWFKCATGGCRMLIYHPWGIFLLDMDLFPPLWGFIKRLPPPSCTFLPLIVSQTAPSASAWAYTWAMMWHAL